MTTVNISLWFSRFTPFRGRTAKTTSTGTLFSIIESDVHDDSVLRTGEDAAWSIANAHGVHLGDYASLVFSQKGYHPIGRRIARSTSQSVLLPQEECLITQELSSTSLSWPTLGTNIRSLRSLEPAAQCCTEVFPFEWGAWTARFILPVGLTVLDERSRISGKRRFPGSAKMLGRDADSTYFEARFTVSLRNFFLGTGVCHPTANSRASHSPTRSKTSLTQ